MYTIQKEINMEEKVNEILENAINVYNQMKVLNDSLMLSFQMRLTFITR